MKTLADVSGIQVQMGADILERVQPILLGGPNPRLRFTKAQFPLASMIGAILKEGTQRILQHSEEQPT